MASSQFDISSDSNDYFFVGGINNGTFTAGKNSFTINPSKKIQGDVTVDNIRVIDPSGNSLIVFDMIPNGSTGYQYSEGYAKIFGVLVYPTTPVGVGRIEISAKAIASEITSSYSADNRWATEQYTVGSGNVAINTVWTKAVYFNSKSPNESAIHFFDFPELIAKSEKYNIRTRIGCGATSVTGVCRADAVTPKNGADANYNYNVIDVKYVINRTSGPTFNSAMVGSSIRFTNIIDSDGIPLNTDFVAKIKKVMTENVLLLDKPLTVSKRIKSGGNGSDSPYDEETGVDVKAYKSFNESDLYSTTAIASGTNVTQFQQIYNAGFIGVSHRKNYVVSNFSSATFEIVYLPRSVNYATGTTVVMARLNLLNLRTLTGAIDRYRVMKRSLNLPESAYCIAEGKLESTELIYDWSAGEEAANLGKFFDLSLAHTYWLTTGGVSYNLSAHTLIDSISISSTGSPNANESEYIILKNNKGEPGRTPAYIPYSLSDGSWFGTDPKRFVNFSAEPGTSYDCAGASPFIGSPEVVKTGAIYNSNFIKLTKNTMYAFSIEYASLVNNSPDAFALDVYFLTSHVGNPQKIKIGTINKLTSRGFTSGTYENRVFFSRTAYGTIQLVPKNITSVSIANVSLTQFQDSAYSIDSAEIVIPLHNTVKNERIELTVDLLDSYGRLVYGIDSPVANYNISLAPLKDIVIADPQ